MPHVPFTYLGLVQTLEDGPELVEALLHPEFVRLGRGPAFARRALHQNVERRLERAELHRLHQRVPPTDAVAGKVQLQVPPPRKGTSWREPLELELPVVRWTQGRVEITYVPALGIEILSHEPEAVEQEIRSALTRKELAGHLRELALLQRFREVRLLPGQVQVHVKTLRERARERLDGKPKRDLLPVVADRVTGPAAFERDAEAERLAELLHGPAPRSVLLVGPSGVGKTALAHEVARRGGAPFWETSGSRLMASAGGFGGWQERCRRVWAEARDTKAILLLGNLLELREVGRHGTSPQGLAGFFRPALERGDFRAVVELTPEGLALLEREDPHLLQAFAVLHLEPPTPEVTRRILARCHPSLSPESLDLAERLHRRFATASSPPGRPLRFLRNLQGDVTRAFSDETGLPLFLIEETEFLDLAATQAWFESRVLGQPEACRLVVDLLATAKAGLNRPRRPIASLLLVGPTGTGKTEMARSLAEFLYGDRTRMVRFDMSEYADPYAVVRLVGGGPQGQGLLTGRVREEPFGVVLFDELEKADPGFFDLLLQVLGEGRLTDAGGRLADFSNTVILMTSNLGAEAFRRGPLGFVTGRASGDFLGAVRAAFRPELFNRIDRIVPFAPLDAATVEGIARRELEAIRQREGLRYRDLVLDLDADVAPHLARVGFDRLYGARPLKRAVEREVLVPLAHALNRYAADVPLRAHVEVASGKVQVHLKAREPGSPGETLRRQATTEEAGALASSVELRRKVGRLAHGPAAVELENRLYRLQRRKDEPRLTARLRRLKDRLDAVVALSEGLEEEAMLAVHGHGALEGPGVRLDGARAEYRELLLALYALQFTDADRVVLGVFSEEPAALTEFGRAYVAAARGWGLEVTMLAVRPHHDEETGTRLAAWPVDTVPGSGVLGVIMELVGHLAQPRFLAEAGLHMLNGRKVLVHTSPGLLGDYDPPGNIHRRGALESPSRRRTWFLESRAVEDSRLGRVGLPPGRDLAGALAAVIEAGVELSAEELVAP